MPEDSKCFLLKSGLLDRIWKYQRKEMMVMFASTMWAWIVGVFSAGFG